MPHRKVKESREAILLEQVESLSKLGTWELDLDTNTINWSDGVYRILGHEPQSFDVDFKIGLSVIHPDDHEKALAKMNEAIKEGIQYDIRKRFITVTNEIRYIRSTGRVIYDTNGTPSKLIGVFQDITEMYEAERNLRDLNERYNLVTRATNDAIWDFDVLHNELKWEEGFLKLFGYDPALVAPTLDFLISLIHPEDQHRIVQQIQSTMADPHKESWLEEYRFMKADGTYAYVVDRAIFIRNGDGKVIRAVGAMADISIRKNMEDSLKQLNNQLEARAQELAISNEELEQFAYVTSHDLQEPLRMISSFLNLLQKKYGDKLDEKAHQYINFATGGAARMRHIILDLLEFSRVGSSTEQLSIINVNEIMNEVKLLQRRNIEDKQAIIESDELPIMSMYRIPLLQIFHNLIGNALKYSKPDVPPHIRIIATDLEDSWKFDIEDNGVGIEPEFYDRIFIVFQRLQPRKYSDGTGMGLAIVKKILDTVGGSISLKSEPGVGSTFTFVIPKNVSR